MDAGIEIVNDFPNAWCEVASQSTGNIRRLVERVPIEKLMFGTDWPFYHQGAGLAKVLIATEGKPSKRAQILHLNAMRLLGLEEVPAAFE
jgi:hypothetical protein